MAGTIEFNSIFCDFKWKPLPEVSVQFNLRGEFFFAYPTL